MGQDDVYNVLKKKGKPMTSSEIADSLKLDNKHNISKALRKLEKSGDVQIVGSKKCENGWSMSFLWKAI